MQQYYHFCVCHDVKGVRKHCSITGHYSCLSKRLEARERVTGYVGAQSDQGARCRQREVENKEVVAVREKENQDDNQNA